MIPLDAPKILGRQSSTSPSDESSILELSFDYELDSAGNYVRISKGSSRSNNSTPPTPHEALLDVAIKPSSSTPPQSSYVYTKPPSPILLNSPAQARRNSLSRSESAYPLLNGLAVEALPPSAHHRSQSLATGSTARSFQRVASAPATQTPAASQVALRAPISSGLGGTGRKIGRPQRVPLDDYREQPPLTFDEREELRARGEWEVRAQEEKENLMISSDGDVLSSDGAAPKRTSPRLATRSATVSQLDGRAISGLPTRAYATSTGARQPLQPGRQIIPGPNRAGRVLMGVKYGVGSGGFDKINENETSENEAATDFAGEETDHSTYLSNHPCLT